MERELTKKERRANTYKLIAFILFLVASFGYLFGCFSPRSSRRQAVQRADYWREYTIVPG